MTLLTNITAYYKFDSSNSNDATANAYNGTDTGMSYAGTSPIINNYAVFAGTNLSPESSTFITVPSGIYSIMSGTSSYTVNLWVKPAAGWNGATKEYQAICFGASTSSFKYRNGLSWQNGWQFWRGDGTAVDSISDASTPVAGTWIMMTIVYDGSNMTMYKDSSIIAGPTASTRNVGTMTVGKLGDRIENNGGNFNGNIDEVGFWTRALSGAEITSLYNSGAGLQYSFGVSASASQFRSLMGVGI